MINPSIYTILGMSALSLAKRSGSFGLSKVKINTGKSVYVELRLPALEFIGGHTDVNRWFDHLQDGLSNFDVSNTVFQDNQKRFFDVTDGDVKVLVGVITHVEPHVTYLDVFIYFPLNLESINFAREVSENLLSRLIEMETIPDYFNMRAIESSTPLELFHQIRSDFSILKIDSIIAVLSHEATEIGDIDSLEGYFNLEQTFSEGWHNFSVIERTWIGDLYSPFRVKPENNTEFETIRRR